MWSGPRAVLFDNGPFVTHPGGGAGGADESWLQTGPGMGSYGFGHQLSAGNRIADQFTIPAGEVWDITNITFFAYQTGASTASTMTGVNVQITDAMPPGGAVVFGDQATNIMSTTAWSNAYRTIALSLIAASQFREPAESSALYENAGSVPGSLFAAKRCLAPLPSHPLKRRTRTETKGRRGEAAPWG